MRKINDDYENPIDHVLLHLAERVSPWFRRLNVTPNMITGISNAVAIISAVALYHRDIIVAVVAFWIAYFFDCLDGHYARKYKMVTIFGDYYDHISDVFKIVAILSVIYVLEPRKLMYYLPVLAFFLITVAVHMYYQEQVYASSLHSPTLGPLSMLGLPTDHSETWIRYTRWGGCGTFMLAFSVMMVLVVGK